MVVVTETVPPHRRGDEPLSIGAGIVAAGVFPTDVGINRCTDSYTDLCLHVPHVRGDEPIETTELPAIRTCIRRQLE